MLSTWPVVCCATAATGSPATGPPSAPAGLSIAAMDPFFDCGPVAGEWISFFKPGLGAFVLSLDAFPGSEPIGLAQGDLLRFSVPETRMAELEARSTESYAHQTPLFGRLFRNIQAPEGAPCIGWSGREPPGAEDLGGFLEWVVAEILRDLPPEVLARKSLTIADRSIELELRSGGGAPARLTVREGEATPLEPESAGVDVSILPLVVGDGETVVLLRILGESGSGFRPVGADFAPLPRLHQVEVRVVGLRAGDNGR